MPEKKSPRMGQKRSLRRILSTLLVLIVALLLLNYLGSYLFFRLDLTADKRYTLNRVSLETLDSAKSDIYVKCYLGGDLPLEFARLRVGIEEMLEEYRVRSGYKLQFVLEDPLSDLKGEAQKAKLKSLMEQGIDPLSVQERKPDGSYVERLVFPYIEVAYRDRSATEMIYSEKIDLTTDANVELSLQTLEFRITSTIVRAMQREKSAVAFLQGHGELREIELADWARELQRWFSLHMVDSLQKVGSLDRFKFVVVADPQRPYHEREKLILDQYLMRGGGLILMLSPVVVSIDSLQRGSETLAYPRDLNLNDMLFRYGVRINPTLIQDMQCARIPINTALAGQPARFTPMPWVYFPLLSPSDETPISRNVNLVYSRFVSEVELIGKKEELRRAKLLTSSDHSRAVSTPRMISLAEISDPPRSGQMRQTYLPVGVLVEGTFQSLFQHRPLSAIDPEDQFEFLSRSSSDAKLVVFGDGRIAMNGVVRRNGRDMPLPLGFDKYTQRTFGNKELLSNVALYLNGMESLLALRGRERIMRLLSTSKITEHRTRWQAINLIFPSLILLLVGGLWALFRWFRYRQ